MKGFGLLRCMMSCAVPILGLGMVACSGDEAQIDDGGVVVDATLSASNVSVTATYTQSATATQMPVQFTLVPGQTAEPISGSVTDSTPSASMVETDWPTAGASTTPSEILVELTQSPEQVSTDWPSTPTHWTTPTLVAGPTFTATSTESAAQQESSPPPISQTQTVEITAAQQTAAPGTATPPTLGTGAEGTPTAEVETPIATIVPEPSTSYSFDDAESLLYIQVFAEAGSVGHDHVMRATNFVATMTYDPSDLSTCAVDVDFAVDDIACDEPFMRDLVGYTTSLNSFEQSSVKSTMEGSSQLYESLYPTMAYHSTGCTMSNGKLRVEGDLTIRGVTQSTTIDMTLGGTAEALTAVGAMSITHSMFEFSPYKFGPYENAQDMLLVLDVIASPI